MAKYIFQLRRGWKTTDAGGKVTRDDWREYEDTEGHLIPQPGELVVEYDNGVPRLKIGDGASPFSELPYMSVDSFLLSKVAKIRLEGGSAWIPVEGFSDRYTQDITEQIKDKITVRSKIDIQPTPEQLCTFHEKDVAFTTVNENGLVRVCAIGIRPEGTYEDINVTISEVVESGVIIGNTTATPNPRPDWEQDNETKADYIKNKPAIESGEGENSLQQAGTGAKATVDAQVAIGKYNAEDEDALFIVGNGGSDAERSNAFVIKRDGSGYLDSQQIATVSDLDGIENRIELIDDRIDELENNTSDEPVIVDSPFEYGEADFSIVQSGTDANAIAEGAIAAGRGTEAGSRGFRYLRNDHNIILNKSVTGGSTSYTYECRCSECVDHETITQTFGNEVFNLDLTQYQSGKMMRDEDTGLIYRHFKADLDSEYTTTTITVDNAPYGIPMFMKYRLNNGSVPTKAVSTSITYGGLEDRHATLKGLVATGTAKAADLATYHEGWVVGRINCLGNIRNHGICNSQQTSIPSTAGKAKSITITIVHSEDLDIAFFMTDDGEDNQGVLKQLYDSGDKYYLITNGAFGTHNGADRWREISESNGVYSTSGTNVTDAKLGNYKTPYLKDAASIPQEEKPQIEKFYIEAPEAAEARVELEEILKTKPDCAVITNNEYPHINLYDYAISKNDQSIKIFEAGTEHTVWRLDFLADSFGGAVTDPADGWQTDAPYKKVVRINARPELGNTDIGMYTFTQGINSKALAYASTALGRETTAEGSYGVALGRETVARYAGFAAGRGTKALGDASIALGNNTRALNSFTVSIGSETEASGWGSFAEGGGTKAIGARSRAGGLQTEAIGGASFAGGIGTKAIAEAQTAIGKYNDEDPEAMLVVGSGSSNEARENCFTTGKDVDGNHYIKVGETVITEATLKAILELLGTSGQEVYI